MSDLSEAIEQLAQNPGADMSPIQEGLGWITKEMHYNIGPEIRDIGKAVREAFINVDGDNAADAILGLAMAVEQVAEAINRLADREENELPTSARANETTEG